MPTTAGPAASTLAASNHTQGNGQAALACRVG